MGIVAVPPTAVGPASASPITNATTIEMLSIKNAQEGRPKGRPKSSEKALGQSAGQRGRGQFNAPRSPPQSLAGLISKFLSAKELPHPQDASDLGFSTIRNEEDTISTL